MTPAIEITPAEWEIVATILQKYVPGHTIIAFGSRVTGRAKRFSDLDLAIFGDKPLSWVQSANLREDFSESDLPYAVDIVDWAVTSPAFRDIIRRTGVVVLSAPPSDD